MSPAEEWWAVRRLKEMEREAELEATEGPVVALDPIKAEALMQAVEHHRGKSFYTASDIVFTAGQFEKYLRKR